jgi:hypothetical protein
MKQVFLAVLMVLVMSSLAFGVNAYTGFNSGEDGSSYTLGDIAGQGTAVGDWAGGWTSTISGSDPTFVFNVATGGSEGGAGDQSLAMVGATSGSHLLSRTMDPWSGDFVLSFDAQISARPTATHQLQFYYTSTSQRPLNIKWDSAAAGSFTNPFKVNDLPLIDFLNPGGNFLGMDDGQWVSVEIVCEWAAQQFDLYWEQTDGSMGFVGTKTGWKDAGFDGNTMMVQNLQMSGATAADIYLANLNVVSIPEPAIMTLVASGCLVLLRRKR